MDTMELHEEDTFSTREEVVSHLKRTYLILGYALTIKRSIGNKYCYLRCDRGGTYWNRWELTPDARQRSTSTRLIGCPFEIRCKYSNDSWRYSGVQKVLQPGVNFQFLIYLL